MKEVVEIDRFVVGVSRVDQESSAAIQGRVADLALKLCSMPLRPACYHLAILGKLESHLFFLGTRYAKTVSIGIFYFIS